MGPFGLVYEAQVCCSRVSSPSVVLTWRREPTPPGQQRRGYWREELGRTNTVGGGAMLDEHRLGPAGGLVDGLNVLSALPLVLTDAVGLTQDEKGIWIVQQ